MTCHSDTIHVVVDTREQRPYAFPRDRVTTFRRMLPAGDYSLVGLETVVAVERKTLDDLVSTVIHGRDRFRRELERLATYDAACVVVEGDLTDIMQHRYRSKAHPHSVLGLITAIFIRHRIPVLFCSNRTCANRFVESYLTRYYREHQAISQGVRA